MKGRIPYTEDEDEAIIAYIKKHQPVNKGQGSTAGNAFWHQVEKEQITSHSWQSMKSRYQEKLVYQIQAMPVIQMVASGKDLVPVASQNFVKPKEKLPSNLKKRQKNKLLPAKRPVYSPAIVSGNTDLVPSPKKSKNIEQQGCTKIIHDTHSETTPVTDTEYEILHQKVQDISQSSESVTNHKERLKSALEQNQEGETYLEITKYDSTPSLVAKNDSTLPLVKENVQPQSKNDSIGSSDEDDQDSLDEFLLKNAVSRKSNEKCNHLFCSFYEDVIISEDPPFTPEEYAAKKEMVRIFLQTFDNIVAKMSK